MARKRKVNDTFAGLCKAGDFVRVFWEGGQADLTVAEVDFEGDIWSSNHDASPLSRTAVIADTTTYVQVLVASPDSVRRQFGDRLQVEIRGNDVYINDEQIHDNLLAAAMFMTGDYAEPPFDADIAAAQRAWSYRNCTLSPSGFRAGCARCTLAQFREACDWIWENLPE